MKISIDSRRLFYAFTAVSISLSVLLFAPSGFAKEETRGGPGKPGPSNLPLCIEDEAEIEKILASMKANPKTDFKYDGYKKALASVSDRELVARLIYSETLAANCDDKVSKILPLIAETIGNRVRLRNGDIKSVVYQRDQFASSLNNYTESHLRHFLCPKNATTWKQSVAATKPALENASRVLPSDTVNYYLYQHSTRFTPPNWKLKEASVNQGEFKECIRFFRSPSWK